MKEENVFEDKTCSTIITRVTVQLIMSTNMVANPLSITQNLQKNEYL
jgi:hypothetical protein